MDVYEEVGGGERGGAGGEAGTSSEGGKVEGGGGSMGARRYEGGWDGVSGSGRGVGELSWGLEVSLTSLGSLSAPWREKRTRLADFYLPL